MQKEKGGKIHDFANGYISHSIDDELARQGIDLSLHPELKKEVDDLKSKLNRDYRTVVKKNRLIKRIRACIRAFLCVFSIASALIFLFPEHLKISYHKSDKTNNSIYKALDMLILFMVFTGSLFEFTDILREAVKKK